MTTGEAVGGGGSVRPLTDADRPWARDLLTERWGEPRVVTRGRLHDAGALPGFLAEDRDGRRLGLVTYRLDGPECELMTLDSVAEGRGVGSALLAAVRGAAEAAGCRRLWLVTMNTNLHALRFYQRRGLRLVAVHPGAVADSRRLKPTIPLRENGLPLRDEIELELPLAAERHAGDGEGEEAVGPATPTTPATPANVEIKARLRDPERQAALARELADGPERVLEQEDTFFPAPGGRLKLRVPACAGGAGGAGGEGGQGAELIQYRRPDRTGPRTSRYLLAPVAEAGALRRVLAAALGEIGTVRKRRRLLMRGRTRIHLDRVEGLGDFLELEVVLRPGESPAAGRAEAERLAAALEVRPEDLVPVAYLDLLRGGGRVAGGGDRK